MDGGTGNRAAVNAEELVAHIEEDREKYLVFRVADELYAITVSAVEEVVDAMPVTYVPRSPAFLRGIINLRGRIIPVLDLRARLALEQHEQDQDSCFMVVRFELGDREVALAVVLDAVEGVLDLSPDQIDPRSSIGGRAEEAIVAGLARDGERILLLVDPRQLLTEELLEAAFAAV